MDVDTQLVMVFINSTMEGRGSQRYPDPSTMHIYSKVDIETLRYTKETFCICLRGKLPGKCGQDYRIL